MKNRFLASVLFLLPLFLVAQNVPSTYIGTNFSRGNELLVLRLAVSCTGEFTQSVPGANDTEKVNEVLKQMKTWLQDINTTFGREYSVRFELIPDQLLRSIIFTNAATDPWPNMTGANIESGDILNIQAHVIDDILGAENYDFSHVMLGNSNGGVAGAFKSGYSGFFDLGVTRHEMLHQFQVAHTINWPGNTNYEPENAGRSIMGGNTHPYTHAASFHQLVLHLRNYEANTGQKFATGNHIPTVNAGDDRAIPVGTPFTLSGVADDPDAGDQLTYVWDQLDMGKPKSLPNANDLEGAIFSRLLPTGNPSRTFPNMDSIVANRFSTTIEQLPTQPRDLNFRLTVNDNHQFNYKGAMVNAGGVNSDDIKITVVDNGGPFQVTSQHKAVTYTGGSQQTINWKVNGTNEAPINTQEVKISLSTDGGLSFPIVLADGATNNGKAEVTMPNINTNLARIKIEAIGNYFFAVNSQNFTLQQNPEIPGIHIVGANTNLQVSERGQTATYTVGLFTNPSGTVTIDMTADAQAEISLDGTHFSKNQLLELNNTTPRTITVRGKYDNAEEGPHQGLIQHYVSASADQVDYPENLPGQPVGVNIADAQIPPMIGIDFDQEASVSVPINWVKISDIRNQSITNIPLDDGTPTDIDLTTSATNCGIGGCGFGSNIFPLPKHTQSMDDLSGVVYSRGEVTFTWSGLQANTPYRLFVFGLGVFGTINQTVTITGGGSPVTFSQTAGQNEMLVNDQTSSSTGLLNNFGKEMVASSSGTITITVTPKVTGSEMSFAGIGIGF